MSGRQGRVVSENVQTLGSGNMDLKEVFPPLTSWMSLRILLDLFESQLFCVIKWRNDEIIKSATISSLLVKYKSTYIAVKVFADAIMIYNQLTLNNGDYPR